MNRSITTVRPVAIGAKNANIPIPVQESTVQRDESFGTSTEGWVSICSDGVDVSDAKSVTADTSTAHCLLDQIA
ncbi:hypothetical protein [Natrialba taiwanensis]|uniref:hypothetical protein n=1 Tax=Natrialba taiwanensis TaxID=160846 RepID=UPI000AA6091F|nr:hypothetical protein [Natrialba taiwanensis]